MTVVRVEEQEINTSTVGPIISKCVVKVNVTLRKWHIYQSLPKSLCLLAEVYAVLLVTLGT